MMFVKLFNLGQRLVAVGLLLSLIACSTPDEPQQSSVLQEQPDAATSTPITFPTPTDLPTETPTASPTPLPPTPTLAISLTETVTPLPAFVQAAINGMPSSQFIIMSDETRSNIRDIYARGEAMGRDPNTFSILGDSLIATPQSLAKWDGEDYTLGDYDYLQPTLDNFAGSFSRYGASVRVGLHSWSVFDPLWADKDICQADEDVLACEIRVSNPSIMLIFLGSNDAGSPGGFNVNYRQLVETVVDQGIVPILATKADRFEGGDNVNNDIIRKVAADYEVPLLEFDILADTLPGRGLGPDNVHLTFLEPLDYSSPEIFTVGYPVHNLASLMILDEVRRVTGETTNN